jgi:16S rRNA (uracil1498-N3)-methyltransferase
VITVLIDPQALAGGETEVAGDAYRHLFRARRVAVGDRLRATDGRGRARWAEVAAVGRSSARLTLAGEAPVAEPALRLTLLVAAPKRERASWLVEKATELGVAAVRLLAGERAPRDFGAGTLARLGRVAAAALEQCHGAVLPELTGVHPWAEMPALLDAAAPRSHRIVLDLAAGARPAAELVAAAPAEPPSEGPPGGAAAPAAPPPRAALLVGPEGGWTDPECAELAALGCRAVTLGGRVLRVETAAVVGAGLLLAAGGAHPRLAPGPPGG